MVAALGIDFGTTHCRACLLIDGAKFVTSVPAVVGVDPGGFVVVGERAERYALHQPRRTVFSIKRLLGRKIYSPETVWLGGSMPNELVPNERGDACVRIGDVRISAEELCAYVLRHAVERLHKKSGVKPERTVIATSAFFEVAQRHALHDAATIAGLDVRRFVESGAAAVLALGPAPDVRRVAIVDIGGGYFDVSVVRRRASGWSVMASGGDALLGGDDFDRRILDHLVQEFIDRSGPDLRHNASAFHRVRIAAREVKHQLTGTMASHPIVVPLATAAADATHINLEHPPMLRDDLQRLWHDELESLAPPCVQVFEDLNLGTEDIDELILLGGSLEIPAVRAAVGKLFRTGGSRPDGWAELPALGAAMVAKRAGRGDELIQSVLPHSISVKVQGGRVSPILPRNRPLPCTEERPFALPAGDSNVLAFEFYQGESDLARDNIYIGRFSVSGLAKGTRHHLRFELDQCGLLAVSVGRDEPATHDVEAELTLSSGLTRAERERLAASLRETTDIGAALERGAGDHGGGTPVLLEPTPSPEDEPLTRRVAETTPGDVGPIPRSERPRRTTVTSITLTGTDPPTLPSHGHPPDGDLPTRPTATQPLRGDSMLGTTLAGRYRVDTVLGEGGMGRVYRASHKILDRQFAVKVLHPELAASNILVQRFIREAQSAARIDSDNVIDILDFGELEDGTCFFVMEFLEGVTLADELLLGSLPIDRLKDIAIQIAKGLGAAHRLGIVHRDLKPNNIKLVDRGDRPLVKILDFGIAKSPTSDGQALTLVNSIVGTPHYMAPEQIFGKVDGRTDIYALGILMYEMATGELPFDDESVAILLNKQRLEVPEPPSQKPGGEDCPPELDAIIMRCLEKDKERRFQSAEELTEALLAIPTGPERIP